MRILFLILCFLTLHHCNTLPQKNVEEIVIRKHYEVDVLSNTSLRNTDPTKSSFDLHFSFFSDRYNYLTLQTYELCDYCIEAGGELKASIMLKDMNKLENQIITPLSCGDIVPSDRNLKILVQHNFRKKIIFQPEYDDTEYAILLNLFCLEDDKNTELEIGSFVIEKGEIRKIEFNVTKKETVEKPIKEIPKQPIISE